jgi:hypothetical protein
MDKSRLRLNATEIKIIAIVLMAFDHVHQMWSHVGAPMWLKWLGRPVFPMFLFAMSESFSHTRSRKRLLLRLLVASWIMTIGNVAVQLALPNEEIVLMNNAFMTFFVAGLYMLFYDLFIDGIKTKRVEKMSLAILLFFVPVLTTLPAIWAGSLAINETFPTEILRMIMMACLLLPNLIFIEGSGFMAAMGVFFYIFRERRVAQITVLAMYSLCMYFLSGGASLQWIAIFASIPMLLYNGEKGRGMKHFFYIFYPAHIYTFYIIATL